MPSSLNVNAKAFEPRNMSVPVDIPLPDDPWEQTEEVRAEFGAGVDRSRSNLKKP